MRCEVLADRLPAAADGPEALDALAPHERRHLDQCLRCQADLAQYRRLRRHLAALGDERLRPPADLATELLLGLDDALDRHRRHRAAGRRAAYLGGLAAATAAGVGGVLVLASRRRPA